MYGFMLNPSNAAGMVVVHIWPYTTITLVSILLIIKLERLRPSLMKLKYKSEGRRWGLEKCVQNFKKQYEILRNLEQMEGSTYSAPDEGTMVCKFIDGVKNSSFDACKTQVMSQPAMGTDLERVINLYKDFLSQTKASNITLNVSRVETHTGKKQKRDNDPVPEHVWMKATVEDKFYNNKEYRALSKAQRAKLAWMREQRGQSPTKKQGTKTSQISALATQMESMTKAMGTITKAVSKIKKSKAKDSANCNHPALTPKSKTKTVTFEESSSGSESE